MVKLQAKQSIHTKMVTISFMKQKIRLIVGNIYGIDMMEAGRRENQAKKLEYTINMKN